MSNLTPDELQLLLEATEAAVCADEPGEHDYDELASSWHAYAADLPRTDSHCGLAQVLSTALQAIACILGTGSMDLHPMSRRGEALQVWSAALDGAQQWAAFLFRRLETAVRDAERPFAKAEVAP